MRPRDKIYNVDNIRIIVNDGHGAATLYGNTRNCVALTIYFYGKDVNNQIVDLSKEEFNDEEVQLIDYETGMNIPREFGREGMDDIIYSTTKNIYCPGLTESSHLKEDQCALTQGKVTYYVYAEARTELCKIIGVRFVLHNMNQVCATTQDGYASQFVNIRIIPEFWHGTSDIEQVSWVESERFYEYADQWNLHIKLNDKHPGNKWIHSEFDCEPLHMDGFPEGLFAMQNDENYGYYYMTRPVDLPQMEVEVTSNGNGHSVITKVLYNRIADALNIVLVKGLKVKSVKKPEGLIRLFDIYGNEGKFRLEWRNFLEDPYGLKIAACNWPKVASVENISLLVAGNQVGGEVVLYGDTKHCVAVIVYFDGKDKDGNIVELNEELIHNDDVVLIDQETGEELREEFGESRINEIIYSDKSSRYYLDPIETNTIGINRQSKVIFYVYARVESELIKNVGVRFFPYYSDQVDTYRLKDLDSHTFRSAKIRVLPENKYS